MTDTDSPLVDFNSGTFDELLGPPVEITDAILEEAIAAGNCSELAFNLYREAAMVVFVVSQIVSTQPSGQRVLPRNQAVCVGLLVRISKFMNVVLQLSQGDRREVIMALNRSLLESAVNLKLLSKKGDPALFDEFVRSALGPEKELLNTIEKNVAQRGSSLPIEDRMKSSVTRIFRLSGMKPEDVDTKHRDWGGTLREKLRLLDEEYFYLFLQRIPSHAVHGTWVDLLLHHLDEEGVGFLSDPEWKSVDARLLAPQSTYVLESVRSYLERFWASQPDVTAIFERLDGLLARIDKTDKAHERFLSQHTP